MFATLVPENGEREHIITDRLKGNKYAGERWEVGCGHNHFPVEDFSEEELNYYEGSAADAEPEQYEFCRNCTDMVHTGLIFEMEVEE